MEVKTNDIDLYAVGLRDTWTELIGKVMGQLTSRQEAIASEVNDPRMKNWLCANIAMRETSQAMAKGVHKKIAEMHKVMLRTLGKNPICQKNCSRFETSLCSICERWQREIISVCEPSFRSRINWSRLNSSQWPSNPYEVARVFMPRAHRLYYKSAEFHEDFRFSLSFLENYYDLPISSVLCERAWTFRSRLKRKNGLMRMGDRELQEGLSVMKELLSLQDLEIQPRTLQRLTVLSQSDCDGCNSSAAGCCLM